MICSCSSWCRATSRPSWSKTMHRGAGRPLVDRRDEVRHDVSQPMSSRLTRVWPGDALGFGGTRRIRAGAPPRLGPCARSGAVTSRIPTRVGGRRRPHRRRGGSPAARSSPTTPPMLVAFYDRVSRGVEVPALLRTVPASEPARRRPLHPGGLRRPGRVHPDRRRADDRRRTLRPARPTTGPRSPSWSRTPTRVAASPSCCSSTSPRPPASGASPASSPRCCRRTARMAQVFVDAGYRVTKGIERRRAAGGVPDPADRHLGRGDGAPRAPGRGRLDAAAADPGPGRGPGPGRPGPGPGQLDARRRLPRARSSRSAADGVEVWGVPTARRSATVEGRHRPGRRLHPDQPARCAW